MHNAQAVCKSTKELIGQALPMKDDGPDVSQVRRISTMRRNLMTLEVPEKVSRDNSAWEEERYAWTRTRALNAQAATGARV